MTQELNKIVLNVGKITQNRIREAINKLTWKAKSYKEKRSFLNWQTGLYQESETELTQVFGDYDPEPINFLNLLTGKYITLDEKNFKIFLLELEAYTESYTLRTKDLRVSEEELIKEREDNKRRTKEEEKRKEEEEKKIHEAGNLTDHDKINLGIKEITRRIREQVKQEFPSFIFSVTFQDCNNITVSLMKSNIKVIQDFDKLTEKTILQYINNNSYKSRETLKEQQEKKYHQLNSHYFNEYNPEKWNNGVFLTLEGFNLFKRISEIARFYNYDHSDLQTDYFDTNFYLNLHIGQWDKPYIYEGV